MLHQHTELHPKYCTNSARNKESEHTDTNLMEMYRDSAHILKNIGIRSLNRKSPVFGVLYNEPVQ